MFWDSTPLALYDNRVLREAQQHHVYNETYNYCYIRKDTKTRTVLKFYNKLKTADVNIHEVFLDIFLLLM